MAAKTEVSMSKQQRTTQLPPEIFALVDGFRATGGAKFNTQCLAAFLQYFFSEPGGPDPSWMRAAVLVEAGDISVQEVPTWIAERTLEILSRQLKERLADELTTSASGSQESRLLQSQIIALGHRLNEWRNVSVIGEGDTVSGLRRVWEHASFGLDVESMLCAADLQKFADFPPGKIAPGDEDVVETESIKEEIRQARREADQRNAQ